MELRRLIIRKILDIDSIMKNIDNKALKKGNNLTLLELRTLVYINNVKIIKPTLLAKEFNVTPATITVQVDRLVKKGYLIKEVDEIDGRSVNLKLTEYTASKLKDFVDLKLKSYDVVFKDLTTEEQIELLRIMEKVERSIS